MQRKFLLTLAICLTGVMVLAACGAPPPGEQPPVAEADPTEVVADPTEPPAEEPTEAPAEEPTEAPAEEPTEAPVEEPTEEPAEEMADSDAGSEMATIPYGSFPAEWLNRNVLGDPKATVLVEAYEEFL